MPDSVPLGPLCGPSVGPGDDDWLRVPIGVVDDPRNQRIATQFLDLTGGGGNAAVVGAARTGKSTLLQTLVMSLAAHHHPFDLQIYAVDLGGGGLSLMEDLPHVGAVLGRSHRTEIVKLIRRLASLVEERAGHFRRHRLVGMDGYHELRRSGGVDDQLGEVVVVVDNWAALQSELPAEAHDQLSGLMAAGLHHGIHIVLTATRWQDLRSANRDHVGNRLELRLADPADSEIDRSLARSVAAGVPGRGLAQNELFVQMALPRPDQSDAEDLAVAIENMVRFVSRPFREAASAPPILTLPERVELDALPEVAGRRLAIGLEEHRLGAWEVDPLGGSPHMLVLGDAESGKTNLLRTIVRQLTRRLTASDVQVAVVDYRRQLHDEIPEEHRFGVAGSPQAALELAGRIVNEMSERAAQPSFGPSERPRPAIVVLIDDYDLVAGAAGNPLSRLVDHVALGRDLGLHLVLARRVGGVTRSSFEPLYQRIRELGTPGIVLSGDPEEGPVIASVRAAPRPPGRGVWVENGRVVEVQAAVTPPRVPDAEIHRFERRAG